jgi:Flp pilus assembly pilin Flp
MHFSRADWHARPPRSGPGALTASRVEGIALHWPAITKPIHGVANVSAALRAWQNFHMDSRGWSDIAYQVAIDQDGNVYQLRGLTTQSGANGDTDVNERFGALLLVVAEGEQPTARMISSARAVIAHQRKLYPGSHRIVGHGQIRPEPTACPGPAVQQLINSGRFEPQQEPVRPTRGAAVDAAIRRLRYAYAHAQPGGARGAKIKAALDQLLALRSWKPGQSGAVSLQVAVLAAIVSLVLIAAGLVAALAIAGRLDDHSTPLVLTVCGFVGTMITALVTLVATVKTNQTAEHLANGGGKEAARQGTHLALQEAAETPQGPIVTDLRAMRQLIASADAEAQRARERGAKW